MTLTTAVLQYAPSTQKTANLEQIRHLMTKAKARGAQLVVLPEYATFTNPELDASFVHSAETLDGPSVTALQDLSRHLSMTLIAGVNEVAEHDRIYNTLVGIQHGELVAVYRKLHLYDAFGTQESTWVSAGPLQEPQLLEVGGFRVGMQTCYDLRFPEVSRMLVDAGAQVLALPAEWVPGPLKEFHWTTLLRARAIENTVYVAAAGQSAPTGIGHSMIVDPMGISLAMVGDEVGLADAQITQQRREEVRKINPALEARRFAVQPSK